MLHNTLIDINGMDLEWKLELNSHSVLRTYVMSSVSWIKRKMYRGPFKSQSYLILLERPHVRIASSNLSRMKNIFSFSNILKFYYIPEGAHAIYLSSVFGKIKGNLNRKLSLDRDCCIIKFASFVFILKLLRQNSWVQSSNCTYLPSHYWEWAGEQNWANPFHRGLLSSRGRGQIEKWKDFVKLL